MQEEKNIPKVSKEMLAEVRVNLQGAYDAVAAGNKKLGRRYDHDIYIAANSGDRELYDLATVVAFYSVRPFFATVAKKYQNKAGKPEIDDFMHDLYIKILKDLKDYDPQYGLIAWLNPWITPIFQETKKREMGQSISSHYQNAGVIIARAVRELEDSGRYAPSDLDIYEYLRDNYPEKKIGLVTIQRVHAQSFVYESLDTTTGRMPDSDDYTSPERSLMSKEKTEEFDNAKNSLSEVSRLIIDMEQEYIRQRGEVPEPGDIIDALKKYDPSVDEKKVANMIYRAHQEMKQKYKKKKTSDSPVNNMRGKESDFGYLEEEENIIMEAIEDDPSLLDDFFSDETSAQDI